MTLYCTSSRMYVLRTVDMYVCVCTVPLSLSAEDCVRAFGAVLRQYLEGSVVVQEERTQSRNLYGIMQQHKSATLDYNRIKYRPIDTINHPQSLACVLVQRFVQQWMWDVLVSGRVFT